MLPASVDDELLPTPIPGAAADTPIKRRSGALPAVVPPPRAAAGCFQDAHRPLLPEDGRLAGQNSAADVVDGGSRRGLSPMSLSLHSPPASTRGDDRGGDECHGDAEGCRGLSHAPLPPLPRNAVGSLPLGLVSAGAFFEGRASVHSSLVQIFDTSLESDPLELPNSSGSCCGGSAAFALAAGSSGSLAAARPTAAGAPNSQSSSQAPDPPLDPGSSWTSFTASITSPTRIAQLFQAVVEAWEIDECGGACSTPTSATSGGVLPLQQHSVMSFVGK